MLANEVGKRGCVEDGAQTKCLEVALGPSFYRREYRAKVLSALEPGQRGCDFVEVFRLHVARLRCPVQHCISRAGRHLRVRRDGSPSWYCYWAYPPVAEVGDSLASSHLQPRWGSAPSEPGRHSQGERPREVAEAPHRCGTRADEHSVAASPQVCRVRAHQKRLSVVCGRVDPRQNLRDRSAQQCTIDGGPRPTRFQRAPGPGTRVPSQCVGEFVCIRVCHADMLRGCAEAVGRFGPICG